jgi:hypothetical protein
MSYDRCGRIISNKISFETQVFWEQGGLWRLEATDDGDLI